MNYVHFIAVRITQVGAIIAVPIMQARPWFTCINTPSKKACGIGCIDRFRMWRGESHHAAISRDGLFEIVRAVNIKARKWAVRGNPACSKRPSIRCYSPTAQSQRDQHRIIEGNGLIKIVCPNGYVTEHPVFLLTKARRYRVILKVGVYSGCRVSRRGGVSALQIADKEKPAMGGSGFKGIFSRSWGNHKLPDVKGM